MDIISEPKVVKRVDWKSFFIALFLGSTLIFLGIAAFYNFQLSKLNPLSPTLTNPPTKNEAAPLVNQSTESSSPASPSAETEQ